MKKTFQEIRDEYNNKLTDMASVVADKINNKEEISDDFARKIHQKRREYGEEGKTDSGIAKYAIYARNTYVYGDSLGPTFDLLKSRGLSNEEICISACFSDGGDLSLESNRNLKNNKDIKTLLEREKEIKSDPDYRTLREERQKARKAEINNKSDFRVDLTEDLDLYNRDIRMTKTKEEAKSIKDMLSDKGIKEGGSTHMQNHRGESKEQKGRT